VRADLVRPRADRCIVSGSLARVPDERQGIARARTRTVRDRDGIVAARFDSLCALESMWDERHVACDTPPRRRVLMKLVWNRRAPIAAVLVLLAGCSAAEDGKEDVSVGEANEAPNCWSPGDDGAPRWDRAGGHQVAYAEIAANGKSQLKLSIDDEVCNLSGGYDDTAIAFAPGGRSYAFLSARTGARELFTVDMNAGPMARNLGCSAVHAGGEIDDAPPVLTPDGVLLFTTKSVRQTATLRARPIGAPDCARASKMFELPVAPTRADILALRAPHHFDVDVDDATQAAYDALLSQLLDEAVARRGGELAALSYESLTEVLQAPAMQQFVGAPHGGYFDRLDFFLYLAGNTENVLGMALDPAYPASKKLAVVTAATGLTIYDGIDATAGSVAPSVVFRLRPSDVGAGSFSRGLSWQGSKIAFSVTDYQRVPRTMVWDGGRHLTDEQIASAVADVGRQWGPLGMRRIAGGLVTDRALDGMEPALGPAGGRGSPRDGERIAFRHMRVDDPGCYYHDVCSGAPPMAARIRVGNHWDVASGGDVVRPLHATTRQQSGPVFRP
jgi:hypothetical protein